MCLFVNKYQQLLEILILPRTFTKKQEMFTGDKNQHLFDSMKTYSCFKVRLNSVF